MRKTSVLALIAVAAALGVALTLAGVAAARPLPQLAVNSVEPTTLTSQLGGTLSIYGSDFTTATVARLVGYGLLDTTYFNNTALQAIVPPGVPAGTYDLQVSQDSISDTLDSALTIILATPTPGPTAVPTPKPARTGRPVLTIRNYSVSPSRPYAGGEFTVRLEVYNRGSRAGENTMVTFHGGTFVPLGETGHLLWQLHINHTAVVTQRLRVPSGLASGTYNLQVNLAANDYEGNHYEYPETVAIEVIGVGHGRPQLVIETAQTEPAVLGPGDTFSLTLRLANRGSRTATAVMLSAASPDLALPARGGNVVAAEAIAINGTMTATLPLVLGEVTQAGRLSLDVTLDYRDYSGGSYSDRQSVGLEVSTALANRPQLIIDSYRTTPDTPAPGDALSLTLEISNVGGGDAQRLVLTLGGEGGSGMDPFAPLDSSNVKFVPRLAAGAAIELTQRLIVDGRANPGAYSLPVALAYDDSRGTRHSDSQLISLLVRTQPHLQIGFYLPVPMVTIGVPFELPIEVTNIGRNTVNVSTVEVSSEQLEIAEGSFYLGSLDGGTSGSWEAMATADEGGTSEVLVTVHYLDDFDQPQVVTETLTVEVEEPVIEAGQDVSGTGQGQDEEEGGFLNVLLRFVRGMLGLGS